MIKLNDEFQIEADTYNYALKEKNGVDKNGNDLYGVIGYARTIEDVLEIYIRVLQREYVRKDEVVTIKDALKEFKKIKDEVKEMLSYLKTVETVKGE